MHSNKSTPDRFKNMDKLKKTQKPKSFNSPLTLNDSKLTKTKNKSMTSLNSSILRTPNATPNKQNESQLPPTPECFANVTLETPRRNVSIREKNLSGNLSKLDVAVRIRPMNERELKTVGSINVVSVEDDALTVVTTTDSTSENKHQFFYDHILVSIDQEKDNFANQTKVYDTIGKPLLDSAFEGYNTCLFAYGQTGSGKSYSMMGTEENAGVIPRFCEDLFSRIKANSALNATVEVSYFEIYNEKVHDLLSSAVDGNLRSAPLNVREHPIWGPYVVDLSIHPVTSFPALWNWLVIGNNQRAVASTTMNDKSSRSHSIFSIVLTLSNESDHDKKTISRQSKINLVDLAGSERLGNAKMNDERLRQSVSINKSLLTLGKVIAALSEHRRFPLYVPYRESVLTWLLRESLGGNSRTCMLATITPASCNVEETLSTLRYASKARNIVNRVRINEDPQDKIIRELRAEVERLQALKQEYQRQSLSSSITSPKISFIETTPEEKSICTIENINGIFHVDVTNLTNTTCMIEDDIVLNNGDKLVIEGGRSFNIEKLEQYVTNDEDKENFDRTNIKDQSLDKDQILDIDELNESIAKLEKYCQEIEEKNKICSTLEFPNDISPYRANFFTELEEILTSVNSPVKNFSTPQVAAVYSPVSPMKSARKQDKNTITKCLGQIQENSETIAKLASTKPEILCAIETIENAVRVIEMELKNTSKTVKFWFD